MAIDGADRAIWIGAMRCAHRNEIIQMNSSRKRRASGATLRASCRPIKVRPRPTMRRFHPATSCSSFSFGFKIQILQQWPARIFDVIKSHRWDLFESTWFVSDKLWGNWILITNVLDGTQRFLSVGWNMFFSRLVIWKNDPAALVARFVGTLKSGQVKWKVKQFLFLGATRVLNLNRMQLNCRFTLLACYCIWTGPKSENCWWTMASLSLRSLTGGCTSICSADYAVPFKVGDILCSLFHPNWGRVLILCQQADL